MVVHVLHASLAGPTVVASQLYCLFAWFALFYFVGVLYFGTAAPLFSLTAPIPSCPFVIELHLLDFPFFDFGRGVDEWVYWIPAGEDEVVDDSQAESGQENGPDKVQEGVVDVENGADHEDAVQGQLSDEYNNGQYLFDGRRVRIGVDF